MTRSHKVLGISEDASPEQIRKAYRKLALKYHPDRNRSPDAEERFKEINKAYTELMKQPAIAEKIKGHYEEWETVIRESIYTHRGKCKVCRSGRCNAVSIMESMLEVIGNPHNNAYR